MRDRSKLGRVLEHLRRCVEDYNEHSVKPTMDDIHMMLDILEGREEGKNGTHQKT